MTSEQKLVRLAMAKQQQTEIFSPLVLSGNGLLSQRQVRGQRTHPTQPAIVGLSVLSHFRTEGISGSCFQSPTSDYSNFHFRTTYIFRWHRKSDFCGYFSLHWVTLWGVWEGNGARSLIKATSRQSLKWLVLIMVGIAMLPPEHHFSISP